MDGTETSHYGSVLLLTKIAKRDILKLMKSVLKIFAPFISIGLFLPLFAFAQTPSLPHQFFGAVNFTNGTAPNGLSVEARINGAVMGSSITANGNYGYNRYDGDLNLLFATDNQGVNAGKTVEFYVSGIKANETTIFANGNSSQLNLTIPASIPTTPTPPPASTGGGGVYIPVSTIKGDINGDKKVDKYDFSLMMANWGKTETNSSDLNNDGKVDKYDFALLMLNWSI